jgi:hypothetical protein
MSYPKDFKWLRGLHRATFYDKRTDLRFEIINNPAKSKTDDKFLYKCFDSSGRLVFDRKVNFAIAMVAINSWQGEPEIQEVAPR